MARRRRARRGRSSACVSATVVPQRRDARVRELRGARHEGACGPPAAPPAPAERDRRHATIAAPAARGGARARAALVHSMCSASPTRSASAAVPPSRRGGNRASARPLRARGAGVAFACHSADRQACSCARSAEARSSIVAAGARRRRRCRAAAPRRVSKLSIERQVRSAALPSIYRVRLAADWERRRRAAAGTYGRRRARRRRLGARWPDDHRAIPAAAGRREAARSWERYRAATPARR